MGGTVWCKGWGQVGGGPKLGEAGRGIGRARSRAREGGLGRAGGAYSQASRVVWGRLELEPGEPQVEKG